LSEESLSSVWTILIFDKLREIERLHITKEVASRHTGGIHYDKMLEACGGHAEHVTDPDQLRPTLERASQATKAGQVALSM
jgi:thiamine pyrophosphate-dependent acetolactate synthase large subunit-like protein